MPVILVVDDSKTDRTIVSGLLNVEAGWQTARAADGNEAMERIRESMPDAVVTDLQMPEMNGLELVVNIKREWPRLPVILMTAAGSEEIAVQALQRGAASYIPKPSLARDLVRVVQRVLYAVEEGRVHSQLMEQLVGCDVAFSIRIEQTLLHVMTNFLRRLTAEMGIASPGDDTRIGMAIDEALLNAYYHGNLEVAADLKETDFEKYTRLAEERSRHSPYRDRRIHVAAHIDPMEARFTVRDEGPGFDVSRLPDPDAPMDLEHPTGRGIVIMRTFMDEVRFNEAGNEVTLVKRRR